ncbi:hypothetical protein U1Q18_026080, partial [Sarracenia purpurea var. burkii]
ESRLHTKLGCTMGNLFPWITLVYRIMRIATMLNVLEMEFLGKWPKTMINCLKC